MPCEERARLLTAYNLATELHSDAVKQMKDSVETLNWDAFRYLQKISADTLDQATRARKKLEEHRSEHGC
jgi:hypothetical protein